MKILIYGGHGFLGKYMSDEIRKSGYDVFSLSRRDGIDLRDYNNTLKHLSDNTPDVIMNFAANGNNLHYEMENPADVFHENVQMVLNIYRVVKDICPKVKIINPLCNCSYPGDLNIQSEQDWWNGEVHDSVFSYGNVKRFIYVIARNYKKQYGINTINFIVPNIYGPGDTTNPSKTHALNGMVIRMIKKKREGGKQFEIWGTGNPVREWVYIKDVVRIIIKGITVDDDFVYPMNIAQNKGYSIKEIAQFITDAVDFRGELVFNHKYQDGAPTKILDDNRFKSIFPNYVFQDLKTGIKETVKYYNLKL